MARILPAGTNVNGYRIDRLLGMGGEGFVFLATEPGGRKVVLKQHKESVSDPAWEVEVERVRRLNRLIGLRHENVCAILGLLECEDLIYVIMEWVDGDTLESRLSHGPLSLGEVASILLAVLDGLAWLHSLDVVHRDVKPGNIIVAADKTGRTHTKLIDLGIALHLGLTRLTRKEFGAGTYEYAPPEVIFAKDLEIDNRADLHSVGATGFHALAGRLPFDEPPGDALFRLLVDPSRPSVRRFNSAVPETMDKYIQRLMAFPADNRPDSAVQARIELQDILSALPPDALARCAADGPLDAVRTSRRLLIESGAMAGTSIPIPRGGITLGRHSLNPDDSFISRSHLRVTPTRKGIVLRDVGSSNGLILGKRRLRTALLSPGESVNVGVTRLKCV